MRLEQYITEAVSSGRSGKRYSSISDINFKMSKDEFLKVLEESLGGELVQTEYIDSYTDVSKKQLFIKDRKIYCSKNEWREYFDVILFRGRNETEYSMIYNVSFKDGNMHAVTEVRTFGSKGYEIIGSYGYGSNILDKGIDRVIEFLEE